MEGKGLRERNVIKHCVYQLPFLIFSNNIYSFNGNALGFYISFVCLCTVCWFCLLVHKYSVCVSLWMCALQKYVLQYCNLFVHFLSFAMCSVNLILFALLFPNFSLNSTVIFFCWAFRVKVQCFHVDLLLHLLLWDFASYCVYLYCWMFYFSSFFSLCFSIFHIFFDVFIIFTNFLRISFSFSSELLMMCYFSWGNAIDQRKSWIITFFLKDFQQHTWNVWCL